EGTLVIVRLAPVDYHRFHFPADGIISECKKIQGYYYSVSTYAIRKNFRIYCENKREYSILKTKKFGDIVIAEIAATMVGGIKQTYKENTEIKKGEEKGCFYFGGSTTILLFEKNKIILDEDILKNSQNSIETKVFMGEKIGVSV
ncbi:MAG: phosphatidylserine decarboxylase, partial [Fusobacteriaceae bacterium]